MQWVIPGIHFYPNHPTLGYPHKHPFDMLLTFEVHGDRQVEFLEFREKIKDSIMKNFDVAYIDEDNNKVLDFLAFSCESLSIIVAEYARRELVPLGFTNEQIKVVVSEQNEFAGVYYDTTLDKVEADYTNLGLPITFQTKLILPGDGVEAKR